MWAEEFARIQMQRAIDRALVAEESVKLDSVALAAVRRELCQLRKLEQEMFANIDAYMRGMWQKVHIDKALSLGRDALALSSMAEAWVKK